MISMRTADIPRQHTVRVLCSYGVLAFLCCVLADCPSAFSPLWIVLAVVLLVLLIGVLLLALWKVIVTIVDNRELQRLKQEELEAENNMSDNPWYAGATDQFHNPLYSGR